LLIKTRPLLGNQLIIALKDTAFLTIITVQELTAAAVLYMLIIGVLLKLQGLAERKANRLAM
jgi:ABC-type arginine/histidine transport system permease subunit